MFAAGLLTFAVVGRHGTYAPPAGLPLKATLVIDSPLASTGQCGETAFGAASCVFNGSGSTLRCR